MFEFYIQMEHSNECINYLNYNDINLSPHINNKKNAEAEKMAIIIKKRILNIIHWINRQ